MDARCRALLFVFILASPKMVAAQVVNPKSLIAEGRLAEAEQALDAQIRTGSASTEAHFLLGLIALERRAYRRAIDQFRMALVQEPGSARLRLELGRAFYLAKDYRNAAFQFERALAGHLPAPVEANVRRFLDRIRRERRWTYDLTLGIAPDTNINAGSSSSETVLFGLPFQLGSDARRKSGVGVVVGGAAEFSPRISDRLQWTFAVDARRRDYSGSSFDDTIVSASSGPQWTGEKVEIAIAGTALWRWYGTQLYQRAGGARAQATIYSGQKTGFTLGVAAQQFDYPTFHAQSGPVWSLSAGMLRVLNPTTIAVLRVAASRQDARTRDLSNRSLILLASATHDFRGGFSVSLMPSYSISNYNAPDAFFGVTRKDRAKELQITLLNRRAIIWRFTPTITYTHLRRSSTIDLYRSRQDRLELGFTSNF